MYMHAQRLNCSTRFLSISNSRYILAWNIVLENTSLCSLRTIRRLYLNQYMRCERRKQALALPHLRKPRLYLYGSRLFSLVRNGLGEGHEVKNNYMFDIHLVCIHKEVGILCLTDSVLGKLSWRDGSNSRTCIFKSYPFVGTNYAHLLSLDNLLENARLMTDASRERFVEP